MEKETEKSFFDFQQIIRLIIKFWYIYIIFLTIFLSIAYYKIRYATPIYIVNGNIQVKDKSTHAYGNKSFLEGANMFQSFKNLSNEIDVMRSYPQVKNVLMQLDFIFTYYNKGSVRDIELYTHAPFVLDYDSSFIITGFPLNIVILDENTYELSAEVPAKAYYDPFMDRHVDTMSTAQTIVNEKHRFGEEVSIGLFVFTINKNSYHFTPKCFNEKYFVYGSDLNTLANQYKAKVQIAPKGDKSSILRISSSGPSIQKETDFVNKLIEVYIKRQLDEKNEIATNTINFIDSQLGVISDSLNQTESNLEAFKSKHKIYDVSSEASSLMGKLNDFEQRKTNIELQDKYYEYLTNYIHSNADFTELVAPSTINISDPLLNSIVKQLVELYQERNTLKYTSSEKSPAYQTILIRIKATKEVLLENTSNIIKSSRYAVSNLNKEIAGIEAQLALIPQKERAFIDISRKYTINDNIYNYLLQKRAEASIARASNLSDATVIEASRIDDAQQIEPKPNKIYTMFFFMAIGCCAAFITVAIILDNKVQTKEDIEKHTGIPVIGAIEQIAANTVGTLVYGKFNSLTESFRSIRTNLQFYLKGKKNFVIGVSSCVSGDGKSFSSFNLARISAVGGRKTVLVCGDLRKVMDNSKYNIPIGAKGLSEYLIGLATLEEVIHQGELEHLFIIPSGPMPPNSAELLGSEMTKKFIEELRTKFEVVIFDTPPVGLVSDYVPLMELVDLNLFVIRYDHTPKQSLEILDYLKDKTDNKVSYAAIFNGVKAQLMAKYSYAYGYMYGGYGYGYGGAPFVRPNKWQRIYRRIKKLFIKRNK